MQAVLADLGDERRVPGLRREEVAIVGPMLGGMLNTFTDWRGLFFFLAAVGVAILLSVLAVFRETLPIERRTSGGFGRTRRDLRTLIGDPVFVGAVLNQGFLYAAIFAYLAGSTYVLQDIYSLSPQWYAAAFALNSAGGGGVVAGRAGGRLAERWNLVGTLLLGILVACLGSGRLLLSGLVRVPVWVVIASLFLLPFGALFSFPAAATLALAEYPGMAGTAGSVLGTVRYGFGGLFAPLVGIAGSLSILPLGIVTTTCALLAAASCLLIVGRSRPAPAAEATGPIVIP